MPRIRALLIEAAREGCAVTYAGLLGRLGLAFTRPKMRALCRTLSRIDEEADAAGEPEMAVLVVRQSDGLPGQGWWTGHAAATGYAGAWTGAWTGPGAVAEVARLQEEAFRYWLLVHLIPFVNVVIADDTCPSPATKLRGVRGEIT